MIKNNSFNKLLTTIGFIGIFILPQLNTVHYDPQPQFWAEITVVWAIIGLFCLTIFTSDKLYIPTITIPLLLFAILIVVQPALLNIDFPGLNYVTGLEMIICIIFAISVGTVKEEYGLQYLVTVLSYVMLSGVILQTLIGFIQYTGNYSHFGDLIFYDSDHPTTNIFGHFGQRNHYAHYLTWGAFALIYLFHRRKLAHNVFYVLMTWLSFSITIAASRSVLIYFPAALLICLLNYAVKRDESSKRLLVMMFTTTGIVFLMEYFYPLLHQLLSSHNSISSGLERIGAESGTGRRGVEWAKAWIVFKEHPIFGYGWNEYAKQSVLLQHLFPQAPANSGLFTNCHNLVLQLLAETGIIGALIVISAITIVIYRTLTDNSSIETIIIMCMLSTTLIHSMDEYPLWYMYFLAGFVFFLSLDKPLCAVNYKLAIGICAVPLTLLIYTVITSSFIFDKLVNYYDTPDEEQAFLKNAKYLQTLVDHNQLWSYFAIYTLDNYINVDTAFTNLLFPTLTQLQYTHKFDQFHPYPDTLMKEAMLQWNMGYKKQAEELVKTAVLAFPVYKASFRDTLKAKRYKPLLILIK